MTAILDDQTLVQSAQHGDLAAFNSLVERYQALLFRVALRMLGDDDRAADACQTAWISAFRNLNGFRGGHLHTWLVRVVVNACHDEIRRTQRRRELPLVQSGPDDQEFETASWMADTSPGVEANVDAREFERTMQRCLLELTPVYRTMLVLVDIEGLSYEDAARAVGVPLGTVRSRLARARLALRELLLAADAPVPYSYHSALSTPAQTRASCP